MENRTFENPTQTKGQRSCRAPRVVLCRRCCLVVSMAAAPYPIPVKLAPLYCRAPACVVQPGPFEWFCAVEHVRDAHLERVALLLLGRTLQTCRPSRLDCVSSTDHASMHCPTFSK